MSEAPALPDECWPIDTGCCADWDSYDDAVKARSAALAVQTLRMLTAYQVGGCPVTVRPCSPACGLGYDRYDTLLGRTYWPVNYAGTWINTCGCSTECGHALSEIDLPMPVGGIEAVWVDGAILDPASYRLDNGHLLVRTDGEKWPATQDLSLPYSAVGTIAVTYLNANPVDGLGAYAAGVLACEYAKACTTGAKCRLPSGVTSIVRQGVSMDIQSGAFPDGVTGIREVDAYIHRWNPNRLKQAPTVWSPDLVVPRRTGVY